MRRIVQGNHARLEFDSITDVVSSVKKHQDAPSLKGIGNNDRFYGDVKSVEDLFQLARDGWETHQESTLFIAEETLRTVERDHQLPHWHSYYDVAGSDVDVARYLSGEPENMIAYTMVEAPRTGRVVSIAMNLAASGSVNGKTLVKRGQNVVALVLALESIGLRVEVYAVDYDGGWTLKGRDAITIVKLKDASDVLDPALLMFALAHPAFYRGMLLTVKHEHTQQWQKILNVGAGYGAVADMPAGVPGLPEGTLVVDVALNSTTNKDRIADPESFVVEKLRDFGLL